MLWLFHSYVAVRKACFEGGGVEWEERLDYYVKAHMLYEIRTQISAGNLKDDA